MHNREGEERWKDTVSHENVFLCVAAAFVFSISQPGMEINNSSPPSTSLCYLQSKHFLYKVMCGNVLLKNISLVACKNPSGLQLDSCRPAYEFKQVFFFSMHVTVEIKGQMNRGRNLHLAPRETGWYYNPWHVSTNCRGQELQYSKVSHFSKTWKLVLCASMT